MSKSKILFKMTGSIACYKACNVISKLVQTGHEVQVVASTAALKFVGEATLEGLTGKPVITDLWSPGNIMDHLHLMRWADLILVAPASSNYINKIAHGVGDDLLTTLFLAHDFKKPFLLAPAMNTSMYLHPVTQKSIELLRSFHQPRSIEVLEAASGVLACGEVGYGKLLDPELIFREVTRALESNPPAQVAASTALRPKNELLKVLITAGGTQEPIDDVRVITNLSTGGTGARIAETLYELGIEVTLLHAHGARLPRSGCKKLSFQSFEDLQQTLKSTLAAGDFDAVIHLAAVSDYSLKGGKNRGKLSSSAEVMTLELKRNPKLVSQLRNFAQDSKLKVIAFKMTSTDSLQARDQAVAQLFSESQADLVIQNDLSEIDSHRGTHHFHWCSPNGNYSSSSLIQSTEQLAERLATQLFDWQEQNIKDSSLLMETL